ncbi:MAG: alpha/beta hydrolase [Chloroflexi bacterium]|nr:alpha/beta hydrolase [Chloroflexota bacterium]
MNTRYLKNQEGTLAYEEIGSGPLVVCVPSMGDLRAEYRFLAPMLAKAGYRVISLDVRGHGATSIRWSDYSVGAIGSDIIALIRSLNAGRAIVIGESMAAGAAVWAAAEAPELVERLVLIGPFVRGKPSWFGKLLYSILFSRPWGPAMWLWYYATLYPAQKPADFAQYSAALRANLNEAGRLEALRAMLLASKAAAEARLPEVKAPVLVLMGTKDPDFKDPAAEAQWVAQNLHGTYHLIEGAGHYPHAELPAVSAPLILEFLQTPITTKVSPYGA